MPMYNLTEYSNNNSKKSGSLWKRCKDRRVLNNIYIAAFNSYITNTDSFNCKVKITGQTGNDGAKK